MATSLIYTTTGQHHRLGLVQRVREIEVSEGKNLQQVTSFIPITHSYSDYESELNAINTEIDKYAEIPVFKVTPRTAAYKTIGHLITEVGQHFQAIKKGLGMIPQYRDTTDTSSYTNTCLLEWKQITPTEVGEVAKEITVYNQAVKMDSTQESFTTTPKDYYNTAEGIGKVRQTLHRLRERITDRLMLLEDLTHEKVNADLALSIQTLGCVESSKMEQLSIGMCNKIGTGLYCTVNVEYLVNSKQYTWYIPVNYNGIQWYGETATDILVHTNQGRWGLLKCEDKDGRPDIFDYCKFTDYNNDCSKEFSNTKIDKILTHCNFSRSEAKLSTLTEWGYLVQGQGLRIKTRDTRSGTYQDLREQTPVLLRTPREIIIQDGENTVTLKPAFTETDEVINYSWLSDKDVTALEGQVSYTEFQAEIDSEDYIDLVLVILMSIVVPAIAVICKKQCQNMDQWEEKINLAKLKKIQRRNLKDNRKVMKVTRV